MLIRCSPAHLVTCVAPALSVLARISARCIVATPVRCRASAPPTCMRQELSEEQSTCAPVCSTADTLSGHLAAAPPHTQLMAAGMVGHPVREVRAHVGDSQHVHEQPGQLVYAGRDPFGIP